MLIDYHNNQFICRCAFEEKHIPKAAGFRWNSARKGWTTPSVNSALKIDADWTQRAIDHYDFLQQVRETSTELSWKQDTDFAPPSPPGKEFMGYQKAGVEYALMRRDTLIADQPGLGKGAPKSTPVLTPSGWVKIGDLKVGDTVLHPYHGPQTVLGVYERGILPTYRVEFSDGSSTLCSDDHLWTFRRPQYVSRVSRLKVFPSWETKELRQIADIAKGFKTLRSSKLRIPQVRPLDMQENPHVIDPYIMGVILGDGSISQRQILITSADDDMPGEIKCALHADMILRDRRSVHDPYNYAIMPKERGMNPYVDELKRLKLMGTTSGHKFIPEEYLFDSLSNRRSLLQGLLDTDGYCAKDGTLQFSSNSKNLVEGVRSLVLSLGGTARLCSKISSSGKDHWITTINLPEGEIPFRLTRKALRYKPKQKYTPARIFTSIEKVTDQEIVCIKVSQPDGLYITDDFIVTHNTIQAIGVLNADEEVKTALFIVPASLKINWYRELDRWMTPNLTWGIAEATRIDWVPNGVVKSGKNKGKTKFQKVETKDYWPNTDVVIINYDILARFEDFIRARQWGLLVCDEAHCLKSEDSLRTLIILGGLQKPTKAERKQGVKAKMYFPIEADRRVFLTGTPILSRPIELWPIVKAFDPDGLGADYEAYGMRYCEGYWDQTKGKSTPYGRAGAYNFTGSSHQEELGTLLRAAFMCRRLKKDVLPDLPPKRRVNILLDSPEIRQMVAREDELAQALAMFEALAQGASIDEAEAAQGKQIEAYMQRLGYGVQTMSDDFNPDAPNWRSLDLEYAAAVSGLEEPAVAIMFEELAQIRRELGLAKLSAVVPWVVDFLEGGSKLILFAYHSDVVKALAEQLADYNPAVIWGGVPPAKRQAQVDKFQENETCRVFIGNIHAAGVGLTLTQAADVAFAEADWVPAMIEQCEDRACRIGQTADRVMVYFLVANGSLDARIAQASLEKEQNIRATIGG